MNPSWPADARILLVDDEPANVMLLEQLLAAGGYRSVHGFTDPRALLAAAAEREPDLVVLDLHMPHMSGLQVLQALRATLGPDTYVPTLVLTADTTGTTRDQALQAGAHDFLTKPFDLAEVRLRTRNLLATRGLHRKLAAHNVVLAEQVAERSADLEESRLELLHRLALAAELRDDDTYQHTVRVGRHAAVLGEAAGMTPEQCVLLRHAAPLHDIGKIGIPDTVLLKEGPLTDVEFTQIKTHSEVGARILGGSKSEVLRMAERIARHHHERWDGRGYPDRLRGEQIPLPARITALVDVFDALTHSRPYKQAWPVAWAVEEMASLRGRHFDPELLDLFLAGVDAGAYAITEGAMS